jgi:hypothetical protein
MEVRGAIMGMQILQYEENDDNRYPIHEITSKATWVLIKDEFTEVENQQQNVVESGGIRW